MGIFQLFIIVFCQVPIRRRRLFFYIFLLCLRQVIIIKGFRFAAICFHCLKAARLQMDALREEDDRWALFQFATVRCTFEIPKCITIICVSRRDRIVRSFEKSLYHYGPSNIFAHSINRWYIFCFFLCGLQMWGPFFFSSFCSFSSFAFNFANFFSQEYVNEHPFRNHRKWGLSMKTYAFDLQIPLISPICLNQPLFQRG